MPPGQTNARFTDQAILPRHISAVISALTERAAVMDKQGRLLRPEEGGHSSSSSGGEATRTRYKPLAPKRPSGEPLHTFPVLSDNRIDIKIWHMVF